MTARVVYCGARTLRVEPQGPEAPNPGTVRVDVAYTGICGTDLHIYHGDMDSRVPVPCVMGHEMSGRIAEVDAEDAGWQAGDHVTVMPLDWCGQCPACLAGHNQLCHRLTFLGVDAAGSMQSSWVVPARTLIRLPADLPLAHAALVEPTAVAVHDVRRSGLAEGEQALIVGGGPIGLLIASVARQHGADLQLIEPDPYRRDLARNLGFSAHDPADPANLRTLHEWTGGAGVAIAFEVSGAAAAVTTAVDALAVRGRLVQVAIHPIPREVSLHRFFWRELTMIGARLYDRDDFETAVSLISAGSIPAAALISRIEPLSRAESAFAALENGIGVMKILIDCQSDREASA
jgi:2-desacetyl-2-hydroxyethyl bacteriochlorophyllide A dehydrogenase